MRLGDVVLKLGSSSSSASSSVTGSLGSVLLNFVCEIDLDYIYDLITTSDGNYLAACTAGYAYNALVKFNKDRIIWAKAFRIKHEGPYGEGGFVSEIDGAYYMTHKYWTDTETYSSAMIYKIDVNGNELWHRSSYSCWADDFPRGIIESFDSTSIIWFFSYYDGGGDFSGGYTPVFYKLDKETGDTIWVKGIANDGYGVYIQLIKTDDNNYMVGHSLRPNYNMDWLYNGTVNYQPMLIKMDSDGNKLWAKHYYRKNLRITDIITSLKQTADSGYIALIDAVSGPMFGPYIYDTLVLKVNSSGVPEWCTKIEDTGAQGNYFDDVPCKIHVMDDGYVFICYDASGGQYNLIKLSLTGSFIWRRKIDTSDLDMGDIFDATVEMNDNGFVIHGLGSGEFGQLALVLFQTDFDGELPGCPYILDGTSTNIVEGYVSEIVYETAYINIIDATYLWTFEQPTATIDFDLVLSNICSGVTLGCSEYFNGTDGSSFTSDVLYHSYNTGVQPTIQYNSLQFIADSRHDYTTTFSYLGEFEAYISFEVNNSKTPTGTGNWVSFETEEGDTWVSYTFGNTHNPPETAYYEADGWDGGSNWFYDYVQTTDVYGKLKIKRDASNNVYVSYWNAGSNRWEWNGDTNGLLTENVSGAYTLLFDCFLTDGSILSINEFVTISGCGNISS
jgi:hypothetical protein